jgi:hypothetical protein
MANHARHGERVFKTAWFTKAAKKAHIADAELCSAIRQVMLGLADDLGGGVYKKRLSRNQYRSIIVARGGQYWVYAYLFAKQDQANINEAELRDLRALAEIFSKKSDIEIAIDLKVKELTEICHDKFQEIQE